MTFSKVLKKHSVVGIVANRSQGKTMMALSLLKGLRREYPTLKIAVMGINPELHESLERLNIRTLYNKMDILDLTLRDTVIFVDEFALLFDSKGRSKQQDKLSRFVDRIEHNNCKLIMSTAREGYFNKFMCGRISCFIVKQIEYDALVNGTWINERVKAIESLSDYRLQMDISEYFVIDKGDSLTEKYTFGYDEEFDTKRHNVDLFDKLDNKKENKSVKEKENKKEKLPEKFVRVVEE